VLIPDAFAYVQHHVGAETHLLQKVYLVDEADLMC